MRVSSILAGVKGPGGLPFAERESALYLAEACPPVRTLVFSTT